MITETKSILIFDWTAFLENAVEKLSPVDLKIVAYVAIESIGLGQIWAMLKLKDFEEKTELSRPTLLKHIGELQKAKWLDIGGALIGRKYALGEKAYESMEYKSSDDQDDWEYNFSEAQ